MPQVARLILVAAGGDGAASELLRDRLRDAAVAQLAASAAAAHSDAAGLEALAAALDAAIATRAQGLDRRSLDLFVGESRVVGAHLLWLQPAEIARLVAEALGLELRAAQAVLPEAGAVVALDWPAADAQSGPHGASLVGFDLDWLPPTSSPSRYPGGPGKAPSARAGGGAPSRD